MLTVCSFTSESSRSYIQYCLKRIGIDDACACAWRLARVDLQANMRIMDVPEHSFPGSQLDAERACEVRGLCGYVLQRSFGTLQPDGELRHELRGNDAARRQPLPHHPLFRGRVTDKNVMVLWIIHIKPFDEETDLKALFEKIRTTQVKGCKWGETCNIKPLAFGIKILEISCVIEDDVCSEDDVIDAIMQFEDEVQSTEIVSFNKISYS